MFSMKVLPGYPDLAIKALKTLLPFPTSYLCESGFSVMAATKDESAKQTGREGHIASVIEFHNS